MATDIAMQEGKVIERNMDCKDDSESDRDSVVMEAAAEECKLGPRSSVPLRRSFLRFVQSSKMSHRVEHMMVTVCPSVRTVIVEASKSLDFRERRPQMLAPGTS